MEHPFSKFLKHILFQSLFLSMALIGKGQIGIDQTLIPKSPNAAAFDKIDPIPVQLATGGTNISFSLYDLKTNSINVPIILQYHSGGIQVDESSTWVGLGWALSVGGSITRTIKGNPDEGIYFNKEKHYYLMSSKYGSLNSTNKSTSYLVPRMNLYDTSNSLKAWLQEYAISHNIDFGTITVQWETDNALYNLALRNNLWGAYNPSYLFNGLSNYPQLYQDVQAANNDPQKAGFPPATSAYDGLFTNGLIDLEPDEFTLKIPGYSGRFYFNTQGQPTLDPIDKDIKVIYKSNRNESDSDVAPYIDTWMVSTPDGKQYYFGYGDSAKSYSGTGNGSRSPLFVSQVIIGWDLTKIVDINTHDSVVFKYKHLVTGSNHPNSEFFTSNNAYGILNGWRLTYDYQFWNATSIIQQVTAVNQTIKFYSSIDISNPNLPHSSINISTPNTSPSGIGPQVFPIVTPKLDSIIAIGIDSSNAIAKYYFNYGHFQMYPKLKLLSFQKISNNLIDVQPPTTFNYYDTTVSPKVFPNSGNDTIIYTPFAQDYWGYYNNAQQNYSGYWVTPDNMGFGTSRKAGWPYMQLGVLNKITYPEGAQTVIQYEPHTASDWFDETGNLTSYNPFDMDTIGGLRVKSIQQINEQKKVVRTNTYSYNNPDGTSSGHLNIVPSVTESVQAPLCYINPDTTNYIMFSTSNRTPKHDNASVVNYSRVTETIIDSSGGSNGYIVHSFYNDANIIDSSFLTYHLSNPANTYLFNGLGNMPYWMSHTSAGYYLLNGLERETDIYSTSGQLQQKITNTYGVKEPTSYGGFIAGCNFAPFSLNNICSGGKLTDYYNYIDAAQAPRIMLKVLNDSTVTLVVGKPNTPLTIMPNHVYYYINYYAQYPKFSYLAQQTKVSYPSSGNSLTTIHQDFYESPTHHDETRTIDYNSKGDTITTVKLYAFDFTQNVNGDTSCKQMQSLYFNPLIASTTFKGNQIQSGTVLLYNNFGTTTTPSFFPASIYLHRSFVLNNPSNIFGSNNSVIYPVSNYFADNNYALEQTENFSINGNILDVQKVGAQKESFMWGYNNQYPVAKITGTNYASAIVLVNQATLDNVNTTDAAMQTELNKIRAGLPNAMVSTYTYLSGVGATSETDPLNKSTFYQYDGYSRLSVMLDQDKNVLKRICYNYAGKPSNCSSGLYFNPQLSQSFTTSCGTGYQPTTMNYVVPAYTYSAPTIAGAIQLAQNDINANGQNYVNTNGKCQIIYYNQADTGKFVNLLCGAGTVPDTIKYIVAAKTYTSLFDQEDADLQAYWDVRNNGQNYANGNGVCQIISVNIDIKNMNTNNANGNIQVTFTNNNTGQVFSSPSLKGGQGTSLVNLPEGNYTVTYNGQTLSPSTAIGIYDSSGTLLYCAPTAGISKAAIYNVDLYSGQQYSFSQILSCSIAPN